jgi:tocopherol O-methyltransferase
VSASPGEHQAALASHIRIDLAMSADAVEFSTATVAAHYDDLDRFYREIWGEHIHHGLWTSRRTTRDEAIRNLVEAVVEEARLRPGDTVCDVGCGYGATARLLARGHRVGVTGMTISSAQHAYALAVDPGAENPRYLLGDWLENELAPASFDAVIAIESTEHMRDLAAFFREAFRVLRPRGRLVVCAWLTRECARTWEKRLVLGPICREGRLRSMETADEYQRLARASGLVPCAYRDVSRQVKRTWPVCIGRAARTLLLKPAYLRYFMNDAGANRIFAVTLLRIWLAYELGSMRYGVLAFDKPRG